MYKCENESEIQRFFRGKCVFVTGGTGFIGKVLVEKFLRSCPGIESIYLLIRKKKEQSGEMRLKELMNDKLFSLIDEKRKALVHSVEGAVELKNLGINKEDSILLKNKVQVVVHCAANVRFYDPLRSLLKINIKGTLELLDFCREMPNLLSIVHVSTAFSHSPLLEINENFYPPGLDVETSLKLANVNEDETLRLIEPLIIGKWANIYAFTKAIVEAVVKERSYGLPVAVFRPSIVLATSYQSPLPGYWDTIYGPAAVFIGGGMGVIRTFEADSNVDAFVVPADLCANGIIAVAWHMAHQRSSMPLVFNFVSDKKNYCTWDLIKDAGYEYCSVNPYENTIWFPYIHATKIHLLHVYYKYMLHIFPGIFLDLMLVIKGKKTQFLKMYRKLENIIAFPFNTGWVFGQDNIKGLYKSLSPVDKDIFNFDMENFDWNLNIKSCVEGTKIYMLNDPVKASTYAIRKMQVLRIANFTLTYLHHAFMLYILWKIFNFFLNSYSTT